MSGSIDRKDFGVVRPAVAVAACIDAKRPKWGKCPLSVVNRPGDGDAWCERPALRRPTPGSERRFGVANCQPARRPQRPQTAVPQTYVPPAEPASLNRIQRLAPESALSAVR